MLPLDNNRLCAIMASLARRANHSEKMMTWIRRQTEMSIWLIHLLFYREKEDSFFQVRPISGLFCRSLFRLKRHCLKQEENTMEKQYRLPEGAILSTLIRFALPVFFTFTLFLQALYGGLYPHLQGGSRVHCSL